AHRAFGLRTPVSVNLSPRQLRDENVPALVDEALTDTGLPPEMLELEITETAVMENMSEAVVALEALSARGVAIAIDDFGTGQSSLAHLRRLPAHKVKLDRSFVSDIETDRNADAIARAVVGLARGLGKTTVAEGVETIGQFRQLRAMGIDEAQGFLFAKPSLESEYLAAARAAEPYYGVAIAA
ncbi:MAG: EAL domain-containing protein, partial [Pseudomonadota bacterium]